MCYNTTIGDCPSAGGLFLCGRGEVNMANKAMRPCAGAGLYYLTIGTYCQRHKKALERHPVAYRALYTDKSIVLRGKCSWRSILSAPFAERRRQTLTISGA